MLERLIDWRLLREAAYTGIDVHPDNIAEARARLPALPPPGGRSGRRPGASAGRGPANSKPSIFSTSWPGSRAAAWDLILAHAFLDLVDLETTLPGLLDLLAPGGFFYFTLNFDGSTIFDPPSMPVWTSSSKPCTTKAWTNARSTAGLPAAAAPAAGFSSTCRRGGTVLAAGSSDWVVFPGPDGYPGDEAYFLHFIIHTVQQALEGHPELPAAAFRAWVEQRHAQIQRGELIYLAHQLDFFGRV